jgi:nuclear cap-binding protein subunit 1
MLKRKAQDEDFQPVIDRIQESAQDMGLDPIVTSTDVFMTAVCWVGSKSLSHVLACVERTKDRLLSVGVGSDPDNARAQIISAVMAYWHAHPGVAISIVEKLLNYSILTPFTVIQWALVGSSHSNGQASGEALSQSHVFEMVFNTVAKVTGRLRQVYGGGSGTEADELVRNHEKAAMRELFRAMEDALVSWAAGNKDEMMEEDDGTTEREALIRQWGARWLRVFRRRSALEEAFLKEMADKLEASNSKNGS